MHLCHIDDKLLYVDCEMNRESWFIIRAPIIYFNLSAQQEESESGPYVVDYAS